MMRIDQALRWWKNHEAPNHRVFAGLIPSRHKKILLKHGKIEYRYGVVSAEDYFYFVG